MQRLLVKQVKAWVCLYLRFFLQNMSIEWVLTSRRNAPIFYHQKIIKKVDDEKAKSKTIEKKYRDQRATETQKFTKFLNNSRSICRKLQIDSNHKNVIILGRIT